MIRRQETGGHPEERGLPTTVRADQRDDATALDREVDRVENGQGRPGAIGEGERQVTQIDPAGGARDRGHDGRRSAGPGTTSPARGRRIGAVAG